MIFCSSLADSTTCDLTTDWSTGAAVSRTEQEKYTDLSADSFFNRPTNWNNISRRVIYTTVFNSPTSIATEELITLMTKQLQLQQHSSNFISIQQSYNTSSRRRFCTIWIPHTIVSDNGPAFTSEEFQQWCKRRGITHLTGAPHHPVADGAAERLVQSFKQAMKKSEKSKGAALLEFLTERSSPC